MAGVRGTSLRGGDRLGVTQTGVQVSSLLLTAYVISSRFLSPLDLSFLICEVGITAVPPTQNCHTG